MARYADGYLVPVLKKNMAAYKRMARAASRVWMDHGALEYRECVGEDLAPGFCAPFPPAVRARKGETVVLAWIVYRSRAHRDRVNAAAMKDPRLAKMMKAKPPFDCDRMVYGGFEVIVEG